jgi:conjugal transfer pilus assembly protein TraD
MTRGPNRSRKRLPKWCWPFAAVLVFASAPISLPTIGLYLAARRFDWRARWLVAFAIVAYATLAIVMTVGVDAASLGESWPPFGASAGGWIASLLEVAFGWMLVSALIAAAAIRWDRREPAQDKPPILARVKAALAPKPPATVHRQAPAMSQVVEAEPATVAVYPSVPVPAPEEIRLGLDHVEGGPTGLYLAELQEHTLLLGATGSGKTTSLLTIIQGAADLGIPVVAIDLKGSPGFRTQLGAIADLAGRRLACWSLAGEAHWNPLARGDASELKDKLVGMEAWTEPHYKRAAERYLQTVFTVLEARGQQPSIDRVVALMDTKALNAELREIPKDLADRIAGYLDQLTDSRDQRSAIAGLATRLALLSESAAGDRLTSAPDGAPTIDIGDSIRAGEVCLFSLDSLRYPELAAQVAGLVIQDLKTVASELLSTGGCRALVAIDEFSALDGDQLLGLLARAREAEIGVLLSTQELADLAKVDPTFADQVIANTNVKLIHRQEVPESAERLAGTIGTYTEWEHTYAEHDPVAEMFTGSISTITGTRRIVEKYKVHPNTFKNLQTGQAVLSIKSPAAEVGVVNITPPRTSPVDPADAASATPTRRQLTPPPESQPPMPHGPPTAFHALGDLVGHIRDNGLGTVLKGGDRSDVA